MPAPSGSQDDHGPTAEEKLWRMRAIACELSLAGLDTHIHEAFTSIDVTATCRASGRRETEAIVDDDGYVELRFWTDPAAAPAHVSALITQALTTVAAPQADSPAEWRARPGT